MDMMWQSLGGTHHQRFHITGVHVIKSHINKVHINKESKPYHQGPHKQNPHQQSPKRPLQLHKSYVFFVSRTEKKRKTRPCYKQPTSYDLDKKGSIGTRINTDDTKRTLSTTPRDPTSSQTQGTTKHCGSILKRRHIQSPGHIQTQNLKTRGTNAGIAKRIKGHTTQSNGMTQSTVVRKPSRDRPNACNKAASVDMQNSINPHEKLCKRRL